MRLRAGIEPDFEIVAQRCRQCALVARRRADMIEQAITPRALRRARQRRGFALQRRQLGARGGAAALRLVTRGERRFLVGLGADEIAARLLRFGFRCRQRLLRATPRGFQRRRIGERGERIGGGTRLTLGAIRARTRCRQRSMCDACFGGFARLPRQCLRQRHLGIARQPFGLALRLIERGQFGGDRGDLRL